MMRSPSLPRTAFMGMCASLVLCLSSCGPAQARTALKTDNLQPLGNPDAPVVLVVFSDFQCSFCKKAAATIKRLQRSHPARFRVYYKHFPLAYHPQAAVAAAAAEAAGMQGKFWQMHDLIFEHAGELSDEIYSQLAQDIGLDGARFERDRRSTEVKEKIAADRTQGENIGVDGTPFFLIDGTPYRGSYAGLERALTQRGWEGR